MKVTALLRKLLQQARTIKQLCCPRADYVSAHREERDRTAASVRYFDAHGDEP